MSEQREEKIDQNNNENESDKRHRCCKQHHGNGKHKCRWFGRALFGVLAIVGVVTVAGALFGPSCGYAGWHHGGHHWSQGDITKRMDKMTDRLIDHVDASAAQEQQIKAITSSYLPRIQSMKSAQLDSRNKLTQLFTQAETDRTQLNRIRKDALGLLDKNSEVLAEMVADIADVLTIEQRQKLAGDIAEFHHYR